MDPIKLEKIQAMNTYKQHLYINNIIIYSLTILICTLFCSTPFWYPPPFSCIKLFFNVSLPQINSLFSSSKFIFIVSNLIIIFLFGESKLLSFNSSCFSSTEVYYSKCVNESRSLVNKGSCVKNKKGAKNVKLYEEKNTVEDALEKEEFEYQLPAEELNKKRAGHFLEKEEFEYQLPAEELNKKRADNFLEKEAFGYQLPAEDLNKRADDFIARVNRQMRLEADIYEI